MINRFIAFISLSLFIISGILFGGCAARNQIPGASAGRWENNGHIYEYRDDGRLFYDDNEMDYELVEDGRLRFRNGTRNNTQNDGNANDNGGDRDNVGINGGVFDRSNRDNDQNNNRNNVQNAVPNADQGIDRNNGRGNNLGDPANGDGIVEGDVYDYSFNTDGSLTMNGTRFLPFDQTIVK